MPTFTELETVEFPPLGTLEAFVISGSLSTTPHTHLGRLERYENKVLRYPGHFATFEAYKRLGLFSEDPVDVDGQAVVPRHLYHRLLEPKITRPAHPRRLRHARGGRGREGRPAGARDRGPRGPLRPGDRLHRHGAPHRLARRDHDGRCRRGAASPPAPTAWSRR